MRLFRRRERVDPLGHGVWRRAHDRFVRAVDRVHLSLDGVPAGPVHDECTRVAARLTDLAGTVHALCAQAQHAAPSDDAERVPGADDGRWLDVHRGLSRAATLTAQCAQALTMARVELSGAAPDADAAARYAAAAARTARSVADLVATAGRAGSGGSAATGGSGGSAGSAESGGPGGEGD